LDKISPEIKLSISDPFRKDGPALVPIPHTPIPLIQNNFFTCYSSSSLSYKSLSLLSTSESKKPTVEIEKNNNVNSNVEIQLLSPQ